MSPSNTFIQASLKTENPKVNHDVEIEINSTVPLKYLSYEVLGRGDILNSGSVEVSMRRTASFRFLATYVMAPTAHVLVYYIRDDGEIVADALDVDLQGTLQNFVDIKVSPGNVRPGESVDLTITSKPNSYIGLLGVDQRSLLLKSGNDISHVSLTFFYQFSSFRLFSQFWTILNVFFDFSPQDQVMKELKSYDMSEDSPYDEPFFQRPFWRPGSATARDVFDVREKFNAKIFISLYLFLPIFLKLIRRICPTEKRHDCLDERLRARTLSIS